MANTKIPVELSSTPGIVDNSNATAITIDSSENSTFSGNINLDLATPTVIFKESGAAKFFIGESSGVGGGSGFYDMYAAAGLGQRFFTGAAERMRIDSSGSLLVNTTSAGSNRLKIVGDASRYGILSENLSGYGAFSLKSTTVAQTWSIGAVDNSSNSDLFIYGGSSAGTKVTLDSSGRLLIGHQTAKGYALDVDKANIGAASFNRTGTDGEVVSIRKDGSTVGSIFSSGGIQCGIGDGNTALLFADNVSAVLPWSASSNSGRDDAIDLGRSATRFDDIYATNGTIQTSDRNEKQDIEALTDAETRVAVAAKGLLRKFRWQSAVEEKGDEARIHFGIIAQDLQDAFTAEGLDASDYAMFISSTWTDEETGEEKTRLGVRYSELLAFIIAAI